MHHLLRLLGYRSLGLLRGSTGRQDRMPRRLGLLISVALALPATLHAQATDREVSGDCAQYLPRLGRYEAFVQGEMTRLRIPGLTVGFFKDDCTWVAAFGYFPKIFGVLLMIACFGYLLDDFLIFLFPSHEAIAYPGLAVAAIAEVSFGLWLLFKGLKEPRQDATAVPT